MTIALVQNGITLRGVTLVPDMVQGDVDSEDSPNVPAETEAEQPGES